VALIPAWVAASLLSQETPNHSLEDQYFSAAVTAQQAQAAILQSFHQLEHSAETLQWPQEIQPKAVQESLRFLPDMHEQEKEA
jgi:hypothetical protein